MTLALLFIILFCVWLALLLITRGICRTENVLLASMLALLGFAVFGWPF